MNKPSRKKKDKVPKLTEEQYAEYVMSLKDEKPIAEYKEIAAGNHNVPHLQPERSGKSDPL